MEEVINVIRFTTSVHSKDEIKGYGHRAFQNVTKQLQTKTEMKFSSAPDYSMTGCTLQVIIVLCYHFDNCSKTKLLTFCMVVSVQGIIDIFTVLLYVSNIVLIYLFQDSYFY